ncbi:MAG: hypothetical protein GX594_18510 [Pirellulaceae bacterium]|nr:hypothetical protein [Pirellulaceae bacterium]
MNPRNTFRRKIYYLAAIAVLLVPLFWLSQPATSGTAASPGSPGGLLARLREQHKISQAHLGEIDPTSVTIKLATVGLRGVAANILANKAEDYKMKKDWNNFGATLVQLTKLQPHYINIWSNQAWNLAYNCSVEFDDYRDRYRWVKKGIEFLEDGIRYNALEPKLYRDMGWTISQKIGKADEHKLFRKLFKEDDDYHDRFNRPEPLRDNWLVGKWWYEQGVDMVDTKGAVMAGRGPLLFRSDAPMCQMNYAEAIEKEGTFDEVAKSAWQEASELWRRYGMEELPTSLQRKDAPNEPVTIRLGELELADQMVADLLARLEAMQPGLREEIVREKKSRLSESQREALDVPPEKRTGHQHQLAQEAAEQTAVSHNEVARRIKGPDRQKALDLADEIADRELIATFIRRYRNIVNFEYWEKRARIEQGQDIIDARKNIFKGDQAFGDGLLTDARDYYVAGMNHWRTVLDANPELVSDITLGEYLVEVIERYRRILNQLDDPFPEPFILQDVWDAQQQTRGGAAALPPAEPQEAPEHE